VRIAIVERFPDPSRNCDPNRVGSREDEIHVLCLGSGAVVHQPFPPTHLTQTNLKTLTLLRRCLQSLRGVLTDAALSPRDMRRLIASALATGGAPFAALAGLSETMRLLRSKHFDRLVCFSSRDFPLVPLLSEIFAVHYNSFLEDCTRYFGEFGFELLAIAPYAYWLQRNGRLRFTQGCPDSRCLYYFSPLHEEFPGRRSYVPISEYPSARTSPFKWDVHAFPQHLDTAKWIAPPYKSVYHNEVFRWTRNLCIVSNKYTREPSVWLGRPLNFIPSPVLFQLLELLTPHYQVVYVRPTPQDIVGDHQTILELGEFEAIRQRFSSVLTIQQIHAEHRHLSFNELQIRLFANCEHFVSVLGGSAFLASYFGGTNIVYARDGWEVSCNAYTNWFHLFSGARVLTASTYRRLLELVKSEFLS